MWLVNLFIITCVKVSDVRPSKMVLSNFFIGPLLHSQPPKINLVSMNRQTVRPVPAKESFQAIQPMSVGSKKVSQNNLAYSNRPLHI